MRQRIETDRHCGHFRRRLVLRAKQSRRGGPLAKAFGVSKAPFPFYGFGDLEVAAPWLRMREIEQLLTLSKPLPGPEPLNHARASARTSPIVWLNLVCLDAPVVAVTWQWLFAQRFHIALTASLRGALFLTAWLIYLADRLADTWALRANGPCSLRQKFCQRHQHAWIMTIGVIALADLWIIFRHLDRTTVRVGVLIGGFSLAYLALNYWLGKIWRFLPIKETCVGSLFAFGTATVLFARIDLSAVFIAPFFLYAALCSLNCISIAVWEREIDRAQHKDSIATRWSGTRFCLRPVALALAVFAITSALVTKASAQLYFCISLSAFLLGSLDWLGERIPPDERTALADLVLLTPLLFLALQFT
jgi:hypothetical protein